MPVTLLASLACGVSEISWLFHFQSDFLIGVEVPAEKSMLEEECKIARANFVQGSRVVCSFYWHQCVPSIVEPKLLSFICKLCSCTHH